MTRQRIYQLRWLEIGKCPFCKAHPPVFRASRCEACYAKHKPGAKPQTYGCKYKARIATLEQRIAKHQKWIAKYEAEIQKLKPNVKP